MKHYLLIGALTLLAQMQAPAQQNLSTNGQSLEGTWVSHVALPGGEPVLASVGTFYPGGGYTGANTNPTHTTHHGVWLRVGDRKFALTSTFFTRDEKGVFNGIVKTRIYITLSEDQNSYEASVERVVMDTDGKEVQVISGIRGRSVRMEIELQRSPISE